MSIESALNKLYSHKQMGIKLSLENIIQFSQHLGNPEKKLKVFHVAGSNGKGSTSSFIASILWEAGYKVGLYTSPHLVKFNERIKINGVEITDEEIAKFVFDNEEYIDTEKPTFFEITTGMAFKHFADNNVDYAVLETGLGGRLDATNIANSLASVISSISLEHTRILGDTLALIAREKAGIIKENHNVFIGYLPAEASNEIENITKDKNSSLFKLKDCTVKYDNYIQLNINNQNLNLYKTPLGNGYQLLNAALAINTVYHTLSINDVNIYLKGIQNVMRNNPLMGRFEYYSTSPLVIFDAAHNKEGIDAFFIEYQKKHKPTKTTLIYGGMKDKNLGEIFMTIKESVDELYLTTIDFERAASIEELMHYANLNGIDAKPLTKPEQLINNFIEKKNNESNLIVLGSIYVLGEIKSRLVKKDLTF